MRLQRIRLLTDIEFEVMISAAGAPEEVADDEGAELGKIVGVSEDVTPDEGDKLGKLVGVPETAAEGAQLGKLVGASERIEVGVELGNLDGISEGANDTELGVIVGTTEATAVGVLEGTVLDRRLGWKLGRRDGAELGRGLRRIITLSMTTLWAPPPRCIMCLSAFAMFSSIIQTPEIVFQPSETNSDDVRKTIALIVCKRFLDGSEVK
jgi:hypothetical protein